MSLFITFEGIEGCGKSYQAEALHKELSSRGVQSLLTFEPGGTSVGNNVRRLLKKQHQLQISPETELFLFSACRAQLIKEVIAPALCENKIIICDRYADSTVAYQGFGRGLELQLIDAVNHLSTRGLTPDLTILLDLPVEEGLKRKKNKTSDRFDSETLEFHRRVRKGYLYLAKKNPHRWYKVDGLLSKSEISGLIIKKIDSLPGIPGK